MKLTLDQFDPRRPRPRIVDPSNFDIKNPFIEDDGHPNSPISTSRVSELAVLNLTPERALHILEVFETVDEDRSEETWDQPDRLDRLDWLTFHRRGLGFLPEVFERFSQQAARSLRDSDGMTEWFYIRPVWVSESVLQRSGRAPRCRERPLMKVRVGCNRTEPREDAAWTREITWEYSGIAGSPCDSIVRIREPDIYEVLLHSADSPAALQELSARIARIDPERFLRILEEGAGTNVDFGPAEGPAPTELLPHLNPTDILPLLQHDSEDIRQRAILLTGQMEAPAPAEERAGGSQRRR